VEQVVSLRNQFEEKQSGNVRVLPFSLQKNNALLYVLCAWHPSLSAVQIIMGSNICKVLF
jgi:hypothetical protein